MLIFRLGKTALAMAFMMSSNAVIAGNFPYSGVELGASSGHTQEHVNKEATLANIETFKSLSLELKAQPHEHAVPFIEVEGSYEEESGLEVVQARSIVGVKTPLPIGRKFDLSPLFGYYSDLQRLCFSGGKCINEVRESFAYGVEARAWLLRHFVEANAGYRRAVLDNRNTRLAMGLALWPTTTYRVGLDWIDLDWTTMLRGSVSFSF